MNVGHKCVFAKIGEVIEVGPDIKIQVIENRNHGSKSCRLRITAPKSVRINLIKTQEDADVRSAEASE